MAARSKSRRTAGDEWRYVSLTIAGRNLDPDKVTKTLKIEPDDFARKGEPFGRNGKTKHGLWSLEGRPSGARFETQIKSILKRISPVRKQLARIIDDQDVQRAYLTLSYEPPGWAAVSQRLLPADLMNEFTSLGIDIVVSVNMPPYFEALGRPRKRQKK